MSQPCTTVELLIVDIRTLESQQTKAIIALAQERAIACGLLSLEADVASAVTLLNMPEVFDFWFGGDGQSLPLDRALALMTVEPARALLISDDDCERAAAESIGFQAAMSASIDLERIFG